MEYKWSAISECDFVRVATDEARIDRNGNIPHLTGRFIMKAAN
jgi:hypothetical protein